MKAKRYWIPSVIKPFRSIPVTDTYILKKPEEARKCMERAVHDTLVKKAKLGQYVIIYRDGKPYKISAAEALLIQE